VPPWHVAGQLYVAYIQILVGKPHDRPLGRPMYKQEENMKVDLKKVHLVDVK
jgi:hypothetical protein